MIRWTDRQLVTLLNNPGDGPHTPLSLVEEILMEDRLQIEKWGVQTHTPAEWGLIYAEELGELCKELCRAHFDSSVDGRAIRKEAIQAATLALKIAEMAEAP